MLLALAVSPFAALANGGTVRTNRATAGPYAVTVFTSPTPLVVGVADVSVSVEYTESGNLEPDARVIITAEPVGHAGQPGVFEATHDQASDPNFYAANVRLDSAGRWKLDVRVIGLQGDGAVGFEVETVDGASRERVVRGLAAVALIWLVFGLWTYRRRRRVGATA